MHFKYFYHLKGSVNLALDGVLKIFSALFVIKIVSNMSDLSLLANFSQLKMVTALIVSVSSSVFILGINKVLIKYDQRAIFDLAITVFVFSGLVSIVFFLFSEDIDNVVGRKISYIYLFVFFGFFANFFVGLVIFYGDSKNLSMSKLKSTVLSFFTFLILYNLNFNIWSALFLYLISYYIYLSIFLFDKSAFSFNGFIFKKNIYFEIFNLYLLTIVSSFVFPSVVVYFRYRLSQNFGWDFVSYWEAEWQISSIFLLILSPILSVLVTGIVTKKLRSGGLTKKYIFKLFLFFSFFSFFSSLIIYVFRNRIFNLLFGEEILKLDYDSSLSFLLFINSIRLVSIVMYYILYIIEKPQKLLFGELLFGGAFLFSCCLGFFNLSLLIPVLVCFLYYLYVFLSAHENKFS
ncbi:hypothetical protein [Marinomonas transparens]|uniref:Polysaccharide biosynthesis protein n=1 Tax=Marinomonas transparens TaxID=2795388 RepID=A0A934MZQ7_9GAMM|nr:hypothetical protein [Marinomonas transparens]MBJ7537805.1 hypothetical protein [Marinomonas transparens]